MTRFNVPFSLFYGPMTSLESAESASFSADFCPKTLFYSFYGRLSPELAVNRRFSHADFYPKLKILFQISLTEKWHFGAKDLWANHLTFSFSHYSIRSRYLSDLGAFLSPTDYRSWSADSFDLHSPAVLGVSPSVCGFKHRMVGELTSPSLSR